MLSSLTFNLAMKEQVRHGVGMMALMYGHFHVQFPSVQGVDDGQRDVAVSPIREVGHRGERIFFSHFSRFVLSVLTMFDNIHN